MLSYFLIWQFVQIVSVLTVLVMRKSTSSVQQKILVQRQPTVLIVDDDFDIRKILRAKLERAECLVLEASNGQEGLVLTEGRCKPDVILLDLVMPIMDGLTMLEHLRNKENSKLVPVLLMTNFTLYKNSPIAHPYILKCSWDLNEIVHKVKTLATVER